MKQEVQLSLSKEEYRYLLEVFNLGLIMKGYQDEALDVEVTEEDSEIFFEVQNEVCKAGAELGIEEIYHDDEEDLYMVNAQSEMGKKADDFTSMILSGED